GCIVMFPRRAPRAPLRLIWRVCRRRTTRPPVGCCLATLRPRAAATTWGISVARCGETLENGLTNIGWISAARAPVTALDREASAYQLRSAFEGRDCQTAD